MDKDRIKGTVEQAKGAVKEAVGKAAGDAKLEVEGRNERGRQNSERDRRPQGRRARQFEEVIGPSAPHPTGTIRPLSRPKRSASGLVKGDIIMDMTTLLIIVVVVLLIGGGGFYGRGRWY